jgi:4-amino-4-deoxy-L-arabinose transferase-like glycosyltransferase
MADHCQSALLDSDADSLVPAQSRSTQVWPRVACCLLVLLAAAPYCLVRLGATDLIRMEPIIALTAENMLDSGGWFLPRLYGEVYNFKPPMAYWIVAASEALLGRTELAVRIPTALSAIALGLLLCWEIGRLASPRAGLFAGLAAVTAFLYYEQARMAGFDVPLTLGVACAILMACRNLVGSRESAAAWMLGYAGLLFGLLIKGLPAPLFYFPSFVLAALLLGKWRMLVGWRHLAGLAVFVLGTGLYVGIAYSIAGMEPFHGHVAEVANRSVNWSLSGLFQSLLRPVTFTAVYLPGSALAVWEILRSRRLAPNLAPAGLTTALTVFAVVGIGSLMFTPNISTRYSLPVIVPLSALAGLGAERLLRAWPTISGGRDVRLGRLPVTPTRVLLCMLAVSLVYSVIFITVVEPRKAVTNSLRTVAAEFDGHLPPDTVLYTHCVDAWPSLVWYLGRPVRVWWFEDRAHPPHEGPVYVIMVDQQKYALVRNPRLDLETVFSMKGPDGRTYALGKATPKEPASQPGNVQDERPRGATRR